MINVRGFAFVAVLMLMAATILAQPILLEINTNFTAHKLEPGGNFASEKLKVAPLKTIGEIQTPPLRISLLNVKGFPKPIQLERPFPFPGKAFSVEVIREKPLKFAKVPPEENLIGEIKVKVPLTMLFPNVEVKKTKVTFARAFRKVEKFKVSQLNITKDIRVSISQLKPKRTMRSSLLILEMKKKVSAYSPLGGLETIGKYLEEDKYAFWANQDYLGMQANTPVMSNWVAYDYHKNQISDLSLSFNAGPFSTLISMKNGNVAARVHMGYGFLVGASISSDSTVSIFSSLPIIFGNFASEIGGEYVVNSSPVIFHPSIDLRYKIGDFLPYVSYSYQNDIPVLHAGLMRGVANLDTSVTMESSPIIGVSFKYFGPFGVFGSAVTTNQGVYDANMNFSSRPFGFTPVQFFFDTNAHVDSLGNYEVSGKLGTTFRLFFSYLNAWLKGTFNGVKPVFTYGMEVSF